MTNRKLIRLLSVFVLFLAPSLVCGKVIPAKIFTDNMVLQQKSNLTVWGEAMPNTALSIYCSWNKKTYNTTVDNSGKWSQRIQTSRAGGPYFMKFTSNDNELKLKNVMLGEVWLCSGQSNMEMTISGWGGIKNSQEEIENANYPHIRYFDVNKDMNHLPVDEFRGENMSWSVCSSETAPHFSAVAYFYGRELHKHLKVPIGLIHASWGGTPVETWTSAEAMLDIPYLKDEVENIIQFDDENQVPFYHKRMDDWNDLVSNVDFGYVNSKVVVAETGFDDSRWKKMLLPVSWEDAGLNDFDGIVWFRKEIDIPAEWENKDLVLQLGRIDDNDITYFNGKKVGETNDFSKLRSYLIPSSLVKSGKATIAVRVDDTGGYGGFVGEDKDMHLSLSDDSNNSLSIALNTEWTYKPVLNWNAFPQRPRYPVGNPNRPSVLFNAMINPIVPYKIKGVIFYQGEENTKNAAEYKYLFPNMIMDWRNQWGYNFPFFYVQLANYMERNYRPEESTWAELREAQLQTLALDNTGMAVTIDVGEAYDIHPKNKQDVGLRLSLPARALCYKQSVPFSGPIYKSHKIKGKKIYITFDHVYKKLEVKNNDELKGFSIAGADGKFYFVEAEIKGKEVVVSSEFVKRPVAVRYAWANNPEANLYNSANLPASPFRTDDF